MSKYWSKADKQIAKKIERKCHGLAFIHEHAAGLYDKKEKTSSLVMSILTMVFGGTGIVAPLTLIIATLSLEEGSADFVSSLIEIILGVCVFILGIVGFYIRAQNYSGKNTNHSRAALSYTDRFIHIHTMRRRPEDKRQDFADFLSEIYRQDLNTRADAGPIPPESIDAYYEMHGDRAIDRMSLFTEIVDFQELNNSPVANQIKKSVNEAEIFQMARYKT